MKAMSKLDEARAAIDQIDQQMAALYEKRMKAVEDVIAWKLENGLPIYDGAREASNIEKNTARIQNPEYLELYEEFLRFLMSQSRKYQKSLASKGSVSYAGIEGSFAQMATDKLFAQAEKIPCSSFEEVIQSVLSRKAEFGVIPFENNNSGLVGEVMDLLLEYPVYIREVYDARIDQCLLGHKDATLKDIEWVYSKDQALFQAREFLDSLGVEKVPYPNTAMAARFVASQQDKRIGAICARENAELYGLKVLASHIEETPTNTTRFLVISASPNHMETGHFSMMLTLLNEVGSLASAIEIISRHGLNMDCIQSRPIKGRPFEYFFYIQCFGKTDQKNVQNCLKELESVCGVIKWMGNYTMQAETDELD